MKDKVAQSEVTLLIKTFERPKSLHALLRSIESYYPELDIVVVDDSLTEPAIPDNPRINYIRTEPDIGVSEGRNIGLRVITTPYFVLLDDDFVFTQNTKLEDMLAVLKSTDITIAAGYYNDFGIALQSYKGKIDIEDSIATVKLNTPSAHEGDIPLYDIVPNFFMAKTEVIQQHEWDSKLITGGQHGEFFVRLMRNNIKSTLVESVSINHYPLLISANYKKHRRRSAKYHRMFMEKCGLTQWNYEGEIYPNKFGGYWVRKIKQFSRYLSSIDAVRRKLFGSSVIA